MTTPVHTLAETFAVLKPGLAVDTVAVSPALYEELDRDYDAFRGHVLISEYGFDGSWPTWERHPAGDEVVVLLSGKATFRLRAEDGERAVELKAPGTYVVVPKNTWHTAEIDEPTRMLFITPGEGTENAVEPD